MKTLATMQITPVGGEPEGKKVGEFRKYKEVLQSASVPIPNKEVVKPPLNGKQVGRPQTVRRHQALSRTSSAPVNIPRRRADAIRRGKKNLARVSSSSGVPGISPGGTHRIIYDREFLMECRESPLSQTPPTDLPQIPGATCPRERRPRNKKNLLEKVDSTASTSSFVSQTSSSCSVDEARHELESLEL